MSAPPAGFLANQVGFLGALAGPSAIALLIYLVIVVGKLAVNCLDAYGGSMTLLTTVSAFTRAAKIGPGARAAYTSAFLLASVLVAIFASADFLDNFKNFVLVLLMVFTPWSAINLTDYYLISKERVDIPALYDPIGRYGGWNVAALISYFAGIAAQIPFLARSSTPARSPKHWAAPTSRGSSVSRSPPPSTTHGPGVPRTHPRR